MKWSREQDQALLACARWMRSSDQVFVLHGFAGTGKTTLARELVADYGDWLYGAYTGKAAHVLRTKGCDAQTLHSIVYRPSGRSLTDELKQIARKYQTLLTLQQGEKLGEKGLRELGRLQAIIEAHNENQRPSFKFWEGSPLADERIRGIVVDEVSMVGERLGKDLERFGKKILVIGDPFQLPPVKSAGYLTNRRADATLTEIHRQAGDSGVLRLATEVRLGRSIGKLAREFQGCDDVLFARRQEKDKVRWIAMSCDQILCGRNATRENVNHRVRQLRGQASNDPVCGDKVICLRNDKHLDLYNGSLWRVESVSADRSVGTVCMRIQAEDELRSVEVESWLHHMQGRGEQLRRMGEERRDLHEFDYGYCVTVHKAQGSQWNSIMLYDESGVFRSNRQRWLYTGITRASGSVAVIS